MKQIHFLFAVLLLSFFSCQDKIVLEGYLDKSEPFKRHITTQHPVTGEMINEQVEIEVGSKKWQEIYNWCIDNNSGWSSAPPASYQGDLLISQSNYNLLFLRKSNDVILNVTKENGKQKQLQKNLDDKTWMLLMDN